VKIALVVYALNVGGMETVLLQLAAALRRKGCDVAFVVTESVGAWHGLPRQQGIEVHDVLPAAHQSNIGHARRVAQVLAGFDVCLLNHSRFAQGILGLLPPGTCTIAILHNLHPDIFRVGLANPANLDAAVAVGEAVRREAERLAGSTLTVRHIPNGIAMPQVPARAVRDASEPLRLACLGRVEHQQKGVLYLPQIAAGLLQRGVAFSLDVVGDGPDLPQLSAALAAQCPAAAVTLHGSLAQESAMQVLQRCDVLLLPSHFEGQPLVLLEAMARGVVPVASRLEGVTDTVIDHERCGLLAAAGKPDEFAAAIARLGADRDLLTQLSAAARSRVREQFDADVMADRYLALIGELRARPRTRTGRVDKSVLGRGAHLPVAVRQVAVRLLRGAGLA
jgi:glycosyltransferase involved in cell wall biosynthesis